MSRARAGSCFGLFDDRVFISESTPGEPSRYFSALLEYRIEAFVAAPNDFDES